jgi:hypothetical protein
MFNFIKNQGKGIVLGASFTLLVTAVSVPALASSYSRMINVEVNTVNILVNGNKTNSDNIVFEGRTYVQLRDLATMMGKEIYWDQATNTASVNDKGVTYTAPATPVTTIKNGYYEFQYTDATYQGNFVNDKRDGYGVCYYNNGAVYDGNFVNGLREDSNATFVSSNGVRYEGQYTNDKQTGRGTKYYSNGVYTGEFVNGIRQGYGVYVWESNNRYEGYWENDKRNGQGTLYYSNGTYDFGTWVNDVLVTRG